MVIRQLAESLSNEQCELLAGLLDMKYDFGAGTETKKTVFFEAISDLEDIENWQDNNCGNNCNAIISLESQIIALEQDIDGQNQRIGELVTERNNLYNETVNLSEDLVEANEEIKKLEKEVNRLNQK